MCLTAEMEHEDDEEEGGDGKEGENEREADPVPAVLAEVFEVGFLAVVFLFLHGGKNLGMGFESNGVAVARERLLTTEIAQALEFGGPVVQGTVDNCLATHVGYLTSSEGGEFLGQATTIIVGKPGEHGFPEFSPDDGGR